ncbi:MAG: glycoside hydrolase family 32 protein [Saprospiraceae bacterium]|nr:glycoside hydrolase family 32 protein [Saprospiraceae bacterium]
MSKSKTDKLASSKPIYHYASSSHQILSSVAPIYYKGQYRLYFLQSVLEQSDSKTEYCLIQSNDLIHWITNAPGLSFKSNESLAGCIIHDHKNTCGLGTATKSPLVTIYGEQIKGKQVWSMSFSLDGGKNWQVYPQSIGLDIKKSKLCDPFIFWHPESGRWIMVISLINEFKIQIHTSKNLIKWEFSSDFGGHPSFKKEWTRVTIIPLSVVNQQDVKKWVLIVTTGDDYPGARYFVGVFNGKAFMCDHALDLVNPVDFGKDLFAPRVFSNAPEHRQIMVAAITNESYKDHLPTLSWKSMISIPRELSLAKNTDGSFTLLQQPIAELKKLRSNSLEFAKSPMSQEVEWELALSESMEFELLLDSHKICTLEFDFGNKAKLLLIWDPVKHQLSLDRTSKALSFHPSYPSIESAKTTSGHLLPLHIFLDNHSIEIFADKGKCSLTSLYFPPNSLQRFRIIGKHFAASGTIHTLGLPAEQV